MSFLGRPTSAILPLYPKAPLTANFVKAFELDKNKLTPDCPNFSLYNLLYLSL